MIRLCMVLVLLNEVSADLDLGSIREDITQRIINRSPYDSIPKVGNKPVAVSINYLLINIQNANIATNEIETLLFLRIFWNDKNLKWSDPSSKAYLVQEVVVPAKEIWTPNIKVYKPIGVPDTYASELLKVFRNGTVYYVIQMTVRTNCDLHMLSTKNPATCSIRLASWHFPSHEVAMSCPDDVILPMYFESSKYDILNATQRANRKKYACCPDYYDDAELFFSFKRKDDLNSKVFY